MTDPSGVTGYQYDNRGNLWKLTNPVNEVTEWLYDPAGRLSQRKLGNGTWEEVSYDARSRVTGIALKKPGATLRQHTYGYNAVSNVTSHTVGIVTTTYGYDLADQLISESRLGYVASYSYDANGNRATRTVNGQTETYVNDAADKLTSISIGGNTVRSFTYDGRGRRKTDTYAGSTTTYSWDAESRLTSLARPGVTTSSFGYNGLDARVSKTDSGGTFNYKRNGAGVTDPVLSDGAATYTPGISERRAGSSKFLHSGMKNADAQSGASANVDSSRTYDAFGNLTGSSGTWSGPFGYAGGFGYQEDPDHGLRLLGHRYYDSSTGRFISKDPIGDGRNWTAYCDNNPLLSFDPTGLKKKRKKTGPPSTGRVGSVKNPKYGPSGVETVTIIHCKSRKEAEERARRNSAKGKSPIHDPGDAVGAPHFHAVDSKGNKKPNTHYSYPGKSGGMAGKAKWIRKFGKVVGAFGIIILAEDAIANGPESAAKNFTFHNDINAAADALTRHGTNFNRQQTARGREQHNRRSGGADPWREINGDD